MEDLYNGLKALAHTSFPRKCAKCGQVFNTLDEFLAKTEDINQTSGLKEADGDTGDPVIELFRNCSCGSTLLEYCQERRNNSEQGIIQRKKFDNILQSLISKGWEEDIAKQELRKVARGQKSELLNEFLHQEKMTK